MAPMEKTCRRCERAFSKCLALSVCPNGRRFKDQQADEASNRGASGIEMRSSA